MPKAKHALVATFLDTEARDADGSDEDDNDEGSTDDLIDFEPILDAHTKTLQHLNYDDFHSAAREEAESIQLRHRRMLQLEHADGVSDSLPEHAIFDWTHKFGSFSVPQGLLWMIRVQRGHERDVVLTIMHWALQREDLRSILSATAPACTHSRVYVESNTPYSVEFLSLHLHFLEPGRKPEQIAHEDYTEILSRKSADLLQPGSWARIKRKGPYFGDTVWISSSDEYSLTYDIVFVPRDVPCDDPEDDVDQNRERLYYLLKGGTSALKLGEDGKPIPPTTRVPNPPQIKWLGGLMEENGISLRWIDERDHRPSLQDLALFRDSKDFMRCPSSQLIHSVAAVFNSCSSYCTAKIGTSVRVMSGPMESIVGKVTDEDATTCTLISADGIYLTTSRSELCLNWSVGDWVKVKDGVYKNSIGWITQVDWSTVSVIIMVLPPETADDAAIGLEQKLSIHSLVDVVYQDPTAEVAGVHDRTGNYSIQSTSGPSFLGDDKKGNAVFKMKQTPSPIHNLEVQLIKKHSEAKGAYGIIKSVNYATKTIGVLTDGLATNKFINCDMNRVRERHTAMLLMDYLKASKADRRSVRAKREEQRTRLVDANRLHPPWTVDASDRWQLLQSRWSSLQPMDSMDESWPPTASVQAEDSTDVQTPYTFSSPIPSGSSVTTHKHDGARVDNKFGQPGKTRPGEWLLDEGLQGHTLDVVLRNAQTQYNGEYNDLMGTICIPKGKKLSLGNRNNSIPVKMNIRGGTQRPFKLWLIYPLTTTEFEGAISAADAEPVLDVYGTRVVIIGPDDTNSRYYVGRQGTVRAGRAVEVGGQLLSFDIDCVCRADNVPRRHQGPTGFIQQHNTTLDAESWPEPAEPLAPWHLRF